MENVASYPLEGVVGLSIYSGEVKIDLSELDEIIKE